ncbi:hypothetical protein NMY22_g11495 [Coprinellus aureogranulatus]|nr:hypothetical protein NMY22_g11495 [Coprinellus aureogranulatus]
MKYAAAGGSDDEESQPILEARDNTDSMTAKGEIHRNTERRIQIQPSAVSRGPPGTTERERPPATGYNAIMMLKHLTNTSRADDDESVASEWTPESIYTWARKLPAPEPPVPDPEPLPAAPQAPQSTDVDMECDLPPESESLAESRSATPRPQSNEMQVEGEAYPEPLGIPGTAFDLRMALGKRFVRCDDTASQAGGDYKRVRNIDDY